jgi:3-oxoacyl-[acyl-carrier protein] reductase
MPKSKRRANVSKPTVGESKAMQFDLKGRVALVTGASRGIGAAIARALAEAGADIAVNYRARAAEADAVAASVRALDRRALAIAADVSDAAAVARMMAAIATRLAPVDILVNNAGIGLVRNIDELTETEFDLTIAVNLKSAFLCTQAVLPHMRAQHWGRIVNISSGAARGAGGVGVHYNASKAGMEGLTRGYAARLVKDGITVNAISPSLIETDMVRGGVASSPARIPMGRFGTPEECAQAVLMVMGNSYMTGQTVQLNGGMSFI